MPCWNCRYPQSFIFCRECWRAMFLSSLLTCLLLLTLRFLLVDLTVGEWLFWLAAGICFLFGVFLGMLLGGAMERGE